MRIFSRRKREEQVSELSLVRVQEERSFDFFAALTKALLVFLIIYGALGGFLSAFEMEYNKGVCMLLLFVLALVLSVVYETGRRWLTNLASMALFVIYLYIAATNYWIINSGYYAVLNRFYEVARDYLDVLNGTEYTLMVEDSYMTVTAFTMFLGMVGVILLNIQLQSKCRLWEVVLPTLIPLAIPLYFDCSPHLIYIIYLFIGYVATAVLQGGNVRERLTGQMRYVLPVAVMIAVVLVRLAAFLMPEETYTRLVPKSAAKKATEEEMQSFAQFGLMALFNQGSAGAGISGGQLSRGSAAMPSYETDLIVRYTPYDFGSVYLKAYTGKDYTGSRWTKAQDEGPEDGLMQQSVMSRRLVYEDNSAIQGRGVMEVEKVGAAAEYDYRPYYTDEGAILREGDVTTYTYYPLGFMYTITDDVISADYLTVPESCRAAVEEVCARAGFSGSGEEIGAQVAAYFQDNYSYTLRPGYTFGNPDYISHFLLNSKRGYCAHFASAGTMLLRNMGIPARYVEGYAFSYASVLEAGTLVEEAAYEDYYDGYSFLGKTGLVEMEIPDAYAHAWVEIYVAGKGWTVIDPTPSSTEQSTASFWDTFMNMEQEESNLDFGEDTLGEYLENVFGGASYGLMAAAVAVLLVFAGIWIVRVNRERKLSGRERVRLEYRRIEAWLSRKNGNYHTLRTLRDQLDWMRLHWGLEISEEQEQALYQAFFAGETDADWDKLRGELRGLKRAVIFSKSKA
ncbi:MAG: transglutaminase-like domain-containing protein [Butyrivibrio sp.]|nr:transglutaminase-like domain-containing protein [Muribaculum sp.]MCM1551559.1 transglutaminase-like domain-containing protein [Butyrivibrio sp.]